MKQRRWGDLEEEESSEEEESDEDEETLTGEQLEQGIASGMLTGIASTLPSGIETDHTLDLRKGGGTTTTSGQTPQLFQVLQEQKASASDTGLMAAGHTYAMPEAARSADPAARKRYAPSRVASVFFLIKIKNN